MVVQENDVLNNETLELITSESYPPREGGASGDGDDALLLPLLRLDRSVHS
jgi:hypothetical protein